MSESGPLPPSTAMFTDLYELTMAQAYWHDRFDQTAVFELFYRRLPGDRHWILATGLDDALEAIERFRFTDEDIDYLRNQGLFREDFLEYLRSFRFTGDAYALPEGTLVFPQQPLIQIVAPLLEAQLIETLLLNRFHFASLVASKAARIVLAAQGRTVVDFGSRRSHGIDAALTMARATYLAGGAGTSLVEAGEKFGIPIFGTMAHSYIQAHTSEREAFRTFIKLFPGTTLLVDTYDTLGGVEEVIALSREMEGEFDVGAVRLDSGDLLELSLRTRSRLDEAGLRNVRIFASGDLNEHKIARLLAAGAPIDGFGVGTSLAVCEDAPALDVVYKLVEYAGNPVTKLSTGKVVYPARKQVFRQFEGGRMTRDILAHQAEDLPGEPLLQPVMRQGQRFDAARRSLKEIRDHVKQEIQRLPEELRSLEGTASYPVEISARLLEELETLRRHREVGAR